MLPIDTIIHGDCLEVLKTLPDEYVDCVITSPPYWSLRDYGVDGQLGLEPTFQEYITKLCDIFDEVKRVLKKEGTCWVNLGDTYAGSGNGSWNVPEEQRGKQTRKTTQGGRVPQEYLAEGSQKKNTGLPDKCLIQIPSRFSIEMCERGWILRNRLIWHKPNAMPSSVTDRFSVDYEDLFFFVKSKKYFFETQRQPHSQISLDRIKKPWHGKLTKGHALGGLKDGDMSQMCHPEGRNMRTVWSINTGSFSEAHFATFPEKLIETPIKAGCPVGGIVLDPFMGSGTTALVARFLRRHYLGIELNQEYIAIANRRLSQQVLI